MADDGKGNPASDRGDREVVRRGVDDDSALLLGLVREFYDVDGHSYDEPRVKAALAPLLAGDSVGQVWVAQGRDCSLRGYVVTTWGYSLESGGMDCVVDEIYVQQRGRGLGERLLARALNAAASAGARRAFLESEQPNEAARRFYRRAGFVDDDSVWMHRWLIDFNGR